MLPVEGHTRLAVDPSGLQLLRKLKGPVAPVVVIGPYRSGKSFLLNQLLGVGCGMPSVLLSACCPAAQAPGPVWGSVHCCSHGQAAAACQCRLGL